MATRLKPMQDLRRGAFAALASLALFACGSSSDSDDDPSVGGSGGAGGGIAGSGGSAGPDAGLVEVPTQPTRDELPDVVHLKTNVLSFNRLYYFAAKDGKLFVKPNVEVLGDDGPWQEMTVPPELEGRVSEISTDDYEIIVLDDERNIWVGVGVLGPLQFVTWKNVWGFPFGEGPGHALPPSDELIRWEWVSVGAQDDLCRPDIGGNCHSPGTSNVSHIWMLFEGGQRLQYNDPWLAPDTSYGSCTPKRGRLKATGFAGSGSHIFVINETGDMFTRLYDFDLSGANIVFVEYSYEPQPEGSHIHQLPPHDWVHHPKIEGGTVTNHISLHKVGTMSVNRTMRVEGTDDDGNSGYFEKDITETSPDAWTFHRTDEPLAGRWFLDNVSHDASDENLGDVLELDYSRNMNRLDDIAMASGVTVDEFAAEIIGFNPFCSPARFRIHFGPDETLDLTLHTVDALRVDPRAERLDDNPRDYNATLELPPAVIDDLAAQSPKVRAFVEQYLVGGRFSAVGMFVTSTELTICPTGLNFDRSCNIDEWNFQLVD